MKRLLLFSCSLALCALVYVQLNIMLIASGYELEALRQQKTELLDQHRVLHYNDLILRSPVILSRRLGERNVQLEPPRAVEMLEGTRDLKGPQSPAFQGAPQPLFPTFIERATTFFARWLEGSRQAEAEQAF